MAAAACCSRRRPTLSFHRPSPSPATVLHAPVGLMLESCLVVLCLWPVRAAQAWPHAIRNFSRPPPSPGSGSPSLTVGDLRTLLKSSRPKPNPRGRKGGGKRCDQDQAAGSCRNRRGTPEGRSSADLSRPHQGPIVRRSVLLLRRRARRPPGRHGAAATRPGSLGQALSVEAETRPNKSSTVRSTAEGGPSRPQLTKHTTSFGSQQRNIRQDDAQALADSGPWMCRIDGQGREADDHRRRTTSCQECGWRRLQRSGSN